MELKMKRRDFIFFLVCIGLGWLAEISFFHGEIGISYLVFITGFYVVLFGRYKLAFYNRRIGLLLMVAIWVLAGSYTFYDNVLFRHVNVLFIPVLVFFHIVLITSPNNINWSKPAFVAYLIRKLQQGIKYSTRFCKLGLKKVFKNMDEQTAQTIKRIIIGMVIGIPLLFVITSLLMSADSVFQDMVLQLPEFILQLNFLEGLFRAILVFGFSFLFFGIFQVLYVRLKPPKESFRPINTQQKELRWDGVIAITILVLLNVVYVLFTIIQFTYFFNGGLQSGFTYAEYARRGFFELVFVTLINWSLLISFLKLVKEDSSSMKLMLKVMYSLLILVSGVMLTSAYQRLSLYETAYGFTLDRLLAHAFMIFLMVIFAYTFIRVWVERLSILHFYLIVALVFYTGLNAISLEKIVVSNNLERYEETGKIDIYYLSRLSYTGLDGLMDLYEKEPDYPELINLLSHRKQWVDDQQDSTWQSFNFTKQRVTQRLEELDY
ncbi:protein of unknown function [Oceanobacillus limi]|uniref:Uncharacterized protein n=1 Tax=Oceanobacillus limi TaxID=930131 RepID=A0A1I0B571_9BACI|nr:DUF4173 domain-containing protein [Oceanobacillus limi]SET01530.1 protein of unknown function [Oceanobacillus limi]